MDIEDSIEEKYNDWLYSTNEAIGLTIEEAKHILANDNKIHYVDELLQEAYEAVLSELEKKDKYIDFYKKGLEREIESNRENVLELIEQDNLLAKKDKIIDEMATFIAGLDIDEDICKNINHCTADDLYTNCEECIIDYFTKKVEGK